jgi:hypothetical protein
VLLVVVCARFVARLTILVYPSLSQRIYRTDLYAALMDKFSSEALVEVFFITLDYHTTWEEVLGLLFDTYGDWVSACCCLVAKE